MGLTNWFQRNIIDPLLLILRRGAELKLLAFSAALGITLGIFPIYGVTVLLCGIAIAFLRSFCHAPTVMLANFIATPIQLSLVVPFLRFGEVISGGPHFPLTSGALKKVFTGEASHELLLAIAHAVNVQSEAHFALQRITPPFFSSLFSLLGWLVASPFILGTLYIVFLPCFKFLIQRFSTDPLNQDLLHPNPEIKLKVRDV